jgi:hypothetical protein
MAGIVARHAAIKAPTPPRIIQSPIGSAGCFQNSLTRFISKEARALARLWNRSIQQTGWSGIS